MTLRFPKQWEAYNNTEAPYLMGQFQKLERLGIPTMAIRGETNGFFNDALWQTWQTSQSSAVFCENKSFGHLMPLEASSESAQLILQRLNQLVILKSG